MKDMKIMKERKFSVLSNKVIGYVIEVHKTLDPGLLESTYQQSVEQLKGIHEAQLLTVNIKQGFLINFNVKLLKQGLKSFVL
jgi:hypothetical protein